MASKKARVNNVVAFFSREKSRRGLKVLRELGDPFESISAEEALGIFQMCARDEKAFNALCTYARQHKTACKELTLEDVRDVCDILRVKKVMES